MKSNYIYRDDFGHVCYADDPENSYVYEFRLGVSLSNSKQRWYCIKITKDIILINGRID